MQRRSDLLRLRLLQRGMLVRKSKRNIIKSIYNLKTHYITPLRDAGEQMQNQWMIFALAEFCELVVQELFFFCSKFRFGNYCIDSVNSWDNCPGMNIKKKSMRDGTNSFLLQACAAKCATGRPKTGSCFISSIICSVRPFIYTFIVQLWRKLSLSNQESKLS